MSVASFEVLLRDVIVQAPHCPDDTGLWALRLATIDFCTETLWWTYMGDPLDVEAGEPRYTVEAPSQAEPVLVRAVWYDGMQLPAQGVAARFMWSARDINSRSSPPKYFTSPAPDQVQLHPVPDVSKPESLTALVAVSPSRSATTCDQQLLHRWSDALVNGALHRVYQIPNQPFTSLDQAKMRLAMYQQDVAKAKIQANKALTGANLSVKPRNP